MSEIEKLRELLAEARMYLTMNGGSADDRIVRRIDAALAEPVEGPLNAISRLQQQLHEAKSNADWLVQQAQRERDEARAEVEFLKNALVGAENSITAHVEHEKRLLVEASELAQEAYQRGAEAMREAAAKVDPYELHLSGAPFAKVIGAPGTLVRIMQEAIRALPIPEDK